MANLGDILRGYGSVLNPQVAQEAAQEDRLKQQQEGQVGMLMLQKKIEQASPQYQAQMEALQNDRQFRLAATEANGDQAKIAGAAVKYGKPELALSLYKNQEDRATRLQLAHDNLEARKQELELKISDKALDRDQKDRFNTVMAELKSQGLALQGEVVKGNQELKRMQFEMKADEGLKKETQNLGKALEKANLPEADATLSAVEQILKKNPSMAEYISGPKLAIPDVIAGPDVTEARQAFNKLFNITLKLRSGAAVTQQELDRLKQEFGVGLTKNPGQVGKAVEQARNIITKHYSSVAGGFGPEALKAYNENIRTIGGSPVIEPTDKKEDPLGIRG